MSMGSLIKYLLAVMLAGAFVASLVGSQVTERQTLHALELEVQRGIESRRAATRRIDQLTATVQRTQATADLIAAKADRLGDQVAALTAQLLAAGIDPIPPGAIARADDPPPDPEPPPEPSPTPAPPAPTPAPPDPPACQTLELPAVGCPA